MMRLPRFEYLEPKDIKEVSSLLSEKKKDAVILAGGTDIFIKMKQRIVTPQYLVNLRHVENMSGIEFVESKGLRIGALVTLEDLSKSLPVIERFSALSQAAGKVAIPQIRNMGTIGGNICLDSLCWYYNQSHQWRKSRPPCLKSGGGRCYVAKGTKQCRALFQADTPAALIALGAKVKVVGPVEEKLVDMEAFYTQKGEKTNTMDDTVFVKEIQIPTPPGGSGGAYLKLSHRNAIDFPIVGTASQLNLTDGKCTSVRIVCTAVASGPVRAKEAEEVLVGNTTTNDLVEKAAELAQEKIRPLPHMSISAEYKRRLIKIMVRGSLRQAWDLAR
ncbi:FAD binding domain-containing protein [Thermodesulfobacteriota bacterium]